MDNKKKNTNIAPLTKWEVIYEDENTLDIWRYDIKVSRINPYEVEILYKNDKNDRAKIARMNKKWYLS